MKRLFVGLTLLLMSFLAALEQLDAVLRPLERLGVPRWSVELVLAAVAVACFTRLTSLRRRLLFPRRGLRLLLAGIAVYALALMAATGVVGQGVQLLATEAGLSLGPLAKVADGAYAVPLFLVAQALLVIGAFRALTNLVPPAEFAEDF